MRKNQPAIVLGALGLFASSFALAQNFQQMPVQSGYNADVIANGVGSSMVSTNNDVDGVSYAFLAKDFQLTSSSTPVTYGLPVNGIVNSVVAATPGLSYQLGNLSANNSLRLAAVSDTGTLVFTTPKAATTLYMLAVSGSGTSTVDVVVNFTDATSQTFSGVSLADWYGGTNFAIEGIGRIKRTTDALEASTSTGPRLYQMPLAINAANQTKLIQSVAVTKASGTGLPNVFAFSADVYSTCAPPTLQPVGTITANSAAISWTAPTGSAVTSYDIYYSTSNTIPASTATPNFPGETGTSKVIPGLNPNTTYYYWVRTNCSTGTSQSVWSFGGTFKTACGTMTSMSESFDTYSSGTTIFPDCWAKLGTGSIYVSTGGVTGNNLYQYSSSAANQTVAVLPVFSNINAGTHWLKFKAKTSTANKIIEVGYVTDPADINSFVSLQSLTISMTTYGPDYTVIVPSSVPATARLAIKNPGISAGTTSITLYYDDVSWEPLPSCFAPASVVASNITSGSATIGWTAPATVPANGYQVYYSTSNVVPTATQVLNASNSAVSTTTSAPVTGLTPNTTYYAWVRSVCSSTNTSTWTYVVAFKTACGAVTSVVENFDSYATGSIVPDCWDRIVGTGSQTITTTTPASGTRNIYQYTATGSTPTYVVLPSFSNINSGVNQLRLKARVSSGAPGSLIVGYVTSIADASTFVELQTLTINNTTYTANAEYVVPVPNTVPANARIAIKGAIDGKSYYWDDVYWEALTLATAEVSVNKNNIEVHPNPFVDVLNISDIKNVKSVSVMDVAGRLVKNIENPSSVLHLGDLKQGLYLVVLNMKDGSKQTIKAIKK
ncbi:fibronectin type III domain-containing protein [Chryseobacterium gwangjuense]|uniref:fibronectin type III domain-containing protein n=1 Tax=Chryseobacterium gwangjuense TaxID=1069980 RepID=UPI001E4A1989|nr:fibronectin type III domain-containing protein [Chryseobacterium gwangjuense]MCE3076781.1 fibronectin type III domain-containing protein [Chryseobacterium gwangjuense]